MHTALYNTSTPVTQIDMESYVYLYYIHAAIASMVQPCVIYLGYLYTEFIQAHVIVISLKVTSYNVYCTFILKRNIHGY